MEDNARLLSLLEKFPTLTILAVGDIYLDENVLGRVTEVSLEAPIPVFEVIERRYNPGAAGNAACNAASLGAKVHMVGVIGADPNGGVVKEEFEKRGVDTSGIVTDPARATSTYGKLRAGGHNTPLQEVLRMDTPRPTLITGDTEAAVIAQIRRLAPLCQGILLATRSPLPSPPPYSMWCARWPPRTTSSPWPIRARARACSTRSTSSCPTTPRQASPPGWT